MVVEFPSLRPGAMVFLGDTGAGIHGVRCREHVYNRRSPLPVERFLKAANGHCIEVLFFGDLDVTFHSDSAQLGEDRIVTLEHVAVAPGLVYNLISFSQLQRQRSILLDTTGAWLHESQIHFTLLGNGNYIQGNCSRPWGSPALLESSAVVGDGAIGESGVRRLALGALLLVGM
eukprot:g14349.t1